MSGHSLYLYCFIFAALIKLCQIYIGDKFTRYHKQARTEKKETYKSWPTLSDIKRNSIKSVQSKQCVSDAWINTHGTV